MFLVRKFTKFFYCIEFFLYIDHGILLKKLDQSSTRGKKDSYLGPSSKVDTKVLKLMVLGLILLRPPLRNLLIALMDPLISW